MTPLRGVTINALPIAEQIKRALQLNATRVMDLFRSWDENGDGQVSCAEFHHAMAILGLEVPAESIDELFAGWDADGGGTLEFYELSKILRGPVADLPTKTALPAISAKVQKTFTRFDVNHSGYLEVQELRKALEHHGLNLSTAEAGRIMSVYDGNPNGKLDLSEFAQVIHDLSASLLHPTVQPTASKGATPPPTEINRKAYQRAMAEFGMDLGAGEEGEVDDDHTDDP